MKQLAPGMAAIAAHFAVPQPAEIVAEHVPWHVAPSHGPTTGPAQHVKSVG